MNIPERSASRELAEFFSKADELLARKITGNKPVIAAWGLMNAGKSYLLNMLTDHLNTEYFRTRDIRETAELKQFEGGSYIFLDTPGLDANHVDDQIAMEGAEKADIILFVHQPQGELEKTELEFLRMLRDSFGEYAEQNIVLILSKSDVENADKINSIEQRMLEQCQNDLHFTPRSFQISGTRFHNGVKKDNKGLINASHVQELKQHLESLNINLQSVKIARHCKAVDEIIAKLAHAEKQISHQHTEVNKLLIKGFAPFNRAMKDFHHSMEINAKQYREL